MFESSHIVLNLHIDFTFWLSAIEVVLSIPDCDLSNFFCFFLQVKTVGFRQTSTLLTLLDKKFTNPCFSPDFFLIFQDDISFVLSKCWCERKTLFYAFWAIFLLKWTKCPFKINSRSFSLLNWFSRMCKRGRKRNWRESSRRLWLWSQASFTDVTIFLVFTLIFSLNSGVIYIIFICFERLFIIWFIEGIIWRYTVNFSFLSQIFPNMLR